MMVALVLGSAACLWADIAALRALIGRPERCVVIAVNDAGCVWPLRIDHWATLHPEQLSWRIERRTRNSYPYGDCGLWTRVYPIGYEHRRDTIDCPNRLDGEWTQGSSGFLGVGVAWEGLKVRRVICAGIPMENSAWIGRQGRWHSVSDYRAAWMRMKPTLAGGLRSMSGWTREQFGAPTAEWLAGADFTSPDADRIVSTSL